MSRRPPSHEVDVRLGTEAAPGPVDPDAPFRLLVLGDFGGVRKGPLASRTPRLVDRDVLEDELGRLGVAVDADPGDGTGVRVALGSLDDFHPDRLLENVAALAGWADVKERLEDPRTFADAARDVRARFGSAPERRAPETAASGGDDDVDDVVGQLLAGAARQEKSADPGFRKELEAIVRPHLAPKEDADLPRLRDAVDAARSESLRAILRDVRFRAVEASWRSLDLLVRRIGDDRIRIAFLDASKEEIAADLTGAASLSATGLYQRVVTETVETPGAELWGAILGLYEFGPTLADAALLARLAKVARAAGAPFLSGASPRLVGCASLAATPDPSTWGAPEGEGALVWEELRALPEAASVALALPRLLLRIPYGAKTDPIDAFPFEEIPGVPDPDSYLWGCGALACALVLAGAFEKDGWALRPETSAGIADLPTHVFREGHETRVTPPSEVVLTVRAAERILEAGLVPVLSLKDSDGVRVARLQSIAHPLRALAGRWA